MLKDTIKAMLTNRRERLVGEANKEKENFENQMKRLRNLIVLLKEDVEIRKMIHEEGLASYLDDFLWSARDNTMGFTFYENNSEFRIGEIVQDLKFLGFYNATLLVGINPTEESFIVESFNNRMRYIDIDEVPQCTQTSNFLKRFCDDLEAFHTDFQKYVKSIKWEEID